MSLVNNFRRTKTHGSMIASFNLLLPPNSLTILGCKLFKTGDKYWWKMPDFQPNSQTTSKDGSKTEWIPYVTFKDKDFYNDLKDRVLAELRNLIDGETAEIDDTPF